jgi:hypothetical protein
MSNTRVTYSYRDAEGQVVRESLILSGKLTDADGAFISTALHQKQFFIPSQVGLDNLQKRLGREINENDSVWHTWEWSGFGETDEPPTTDLLATTLVESFEYACWDTLAASAELYDQPVQRPRMAMRM